MSFKSDKEARRYAKMKADPQRWEAYKKRQRERYRTRRPQPNSETKNCSVCGEQFSVLLYKNETKRCTECRKLRRTRPSNPRPRYRRPVIKCTYCGQETPQKIKWRNGRKAKSSFCNRECYLSTVKTQPPPWDPRPRRARTVYKFTPVWIYKCKWCGLWKVNQRSSNKARPEICSQSCRMNQRYRTSRTSRSAGWDMTCVVCGENYKTISRGKNSKYCSIKCQRWVHMKRLAPLTEDFETIPFLRRLHLAGQRTQKTNRLAFLIKKKQKGERFNEIEMRELFQII